MKRNTLLAAAALGVAVALPFSFDHPVAQAAAPAPVVNTDPDAVHAAHQKLHPRTPAEIAELKTHLQVRDGGQGKVVGSRKATKAEVASGFAAATTSTVYICSEGANLKNPLTNTLDRDNWVGVGWDESSDNNGSPMARIHSGSAPLVVHNNQTFTIYWSSAMWENIGGLLYQWVRWYYNQTALNAVHPNGGELGMAVLSDGNASSQGTLWYNQEHHASGFETWVAYTTTSVPAVDITLWGSGSNANKNALTEVYIQASNSTPCGHVASLNY